MEQQDVLTDAQIKLDAKRKMEERANRQLEKNEAAKFEVGDRVRVSMRRLYSKVRKQEKQNDVKKIVVTYSPEIYTVHKVIEVDKMFEREKYMLVDSEGNPLLTEYKANRPNANRQSARFYSSDLQKVNDTSSKSKYSMKMNKAHKLNDMVELQE